MTATRRRKTSHNFSKGSGNGTNGKRRSAGSGTGKGGKKQSDCESSAPVGMGLDLSLTATGLVVWDGQRVLRGGVLATEPMPKKVKDQSPRLRVRRDGTKVYRGLNREARIEYIAKRVASSIRKFQPGVVCVEGYSFGSKGSSMTDLAELRGVILNRVHRAGLDTEQIIAPPTLKKLATGNGRADKIEVVEMAQDAWPGCPNEDNVADAFWLAVIAQERYEKMMVF